MLANSTMALAEIEEGNRTQALARLDAIGPKFDVRVQIDSNAHKAADKLAAAVVQTYYDQSDLVYESMKEFHFGPLRVAKKATPFVNSLYEKYSNFNAFELDYAKALDATGLTWHRNPANGGFSIPLLSEGATANFFPDFIVWKKGVIYCLDTKGSFILPEAATRKLFDIFEDGKIKVHVRLISEGKQTKLLEKPIKGGYTVWKMKAGQPTAVHLPDLKKTVAECLK